MAGIACCWSSPAPDVLPFSQPSRVGRVSGVVGGRNTCPGGRPELGYDVTNWRLRFFPRSLREWGEAYVADSGDGRGFARVAVYAWYLTIRHHPVRAIVIATSVLSAATGLYLAGLLQVVASPNDPLFGRMITLSAIGLVLQGGYTLLYMTGRPPNPPTPGMPGVGGFGGQLGPSQGTLCGVNTSNRRTTFSSGVGPS